MSEITREFIAALAQSMGGLVQPDSADPDRRLPGIRFDSPRCVLHLRTCWQPRGMWHAFVCDDKGHCISGSATANFNPTRHISGIATDLRRRVLEPSRTAIIAHATTQGSKAVASRELRERIEKLEAVFGVKNDTEGYQHNHFVKLPQFRIASEYHLAGSARRGRFTAEISVESFDCLLMIARLVAEDHRLQFSAPR